jgi:pyruvate kinase
MEQEMRKAKIICTLGPASESATVIARLIRAGMDVARLNFSHGTQFEHQRRLELVRSVAKKLDRPVAVLQDIQGPKIRVGRFADGQIALKAGQQAVITTRRVVGGGTTIPTPNKALPKDVKPGEPILIDDGRVRLEVLRVRGPDVLCRVLSGGAIKDAKGINLPQTRVSIPTLTPKDKADLAFGQRLGVDFVALSFVRSAEDVERARPYVSRLKTPLIAKIEKPEAVTRLQEIAEAADGVMIARGDLGVEMPLERLPRIQKDALNLVNRLGGIAIVATEMLESMIHNSRPTRAEVSDVANAILDGADAVMLSAETAVGRFPVESARTMARIVIESEKRGVQPAAPFEKSPEISTAVAAAAVAAAAQLKIDLVVAYTESGYTARLISEFRPRVKILALTPSREVVRRTALYWGVQGMLVGRLDSTDAMLREVRRICLERHLCRRGVPVVIVAGVPLNVPGNTNLMSIHRI